LSERYLSLSSEVHGLSDFAKTAYPDMISAESGERKRTRRSRN
jgi:hypothetical protein